MTQSTSIISHKPLVTLANWNYSQLTRDEKRAFISMAAEPDQGIFYSVTVVEGETRELSSVDFKSLNEACLYINKEFERWDFIDLSKSNKSDSGCSSCVAH